MAKLNFENCGRKVFRYTALIFDGNSRSTGISQLQAGKTQSKNLLFPFHIHITNPECIRIPWVLAPKKFR